MKNFKLSIIFCVNLLLIFSTSLNSQTCLIFSLNDDLKSSFGSDLKVFFDNSNNTNGIKAWAGLINYPAYRKDINWLTRANVWISEGGNFVTTNNLTKLTKNGDEIFEIKNGLILPTRYNYPVTDGTAIGEICNGYQVIKNGEILSVRRVPDVSGYTNAELDFLEGHLDAHMLERHGHDVTDDAIRKRAQTGIAPDGYPSNAPSYSSKFSSRELVSEAIINVNPSSSAFGLKKWDGSKWIVEAPGNYGYGISNSNGGNGPLVQMLKVTAWYEEVGTGNFKLITMFPNK